VSDTTNLLIVDDNPAQRLALAAILSDLDVHVVQAASGREALRSLLRQEFAVILLDVNMPGLDGFETASLIRERRSSERTPIIFITAYSDDARVERGYSLGAVDYILTPVQPNVLRAKVSVFLDLYRKTEEVRSQREHMRRYAMQLQQLSDAALAINSARSVDEIATVVTDRALQIIDAHQASTTADTLEADRRLTVTEVSQKYGGNRHVRSYASSSPFELATAKRFTAAQLAAGVFPERVPGEVVPGVPIHGWLAAPLVARDGRRIGVLEVSEKREGEFGPDDERILVQLAQIAAVAIDNTSAAEARESNRLKDEFLGVLSHELRTPLQAMLTWISILRREHVDPSLVARGLEVIERSARTQTQLISDLLDVSRIIRGQLRLDSGPTNLATVVDLALETLRPAAAARRIAIEWNPPREECWIIGDATRLQQVVWNLLSNAIKFTPEGGRIELRLTLDDTSVSVAVRDTGSGIPPDFLPHLFERFRQADSSAGRKHGGLGLGLAIVRHLVELHGGAISAENLAHGGAAFTVRLPRSPRASLQRSGFGPDNSSRPSGTRLDGIRVVLVEDEPDTRESMTTALQLFGAHVVAVSSASAALLALEHQRPDVLLSDLGMPGDDGYTLIRQVRAREAEEGGRLPAAALTAHVRPEDSAGALRAGFDTHVHKPVEPLELATVVRRLAGRK
jgi:signal transduction histidine kinase/DNA-binding response OmpR family regulator